MFVKFSTEAMKVVQGTKDPGVITKTAKKVDGRSGDPNTLERNKKISHKADPKKGAVKLSGAKAKAMESKDTKAQGKKPSALPAMPQKQAKSMDGGPKVHDPEGMF